MPTKFIKELERLEIYHYLTSGIGPRPIALVSTISNDGKINLAPFSFFNVFSVTPPVVGFSPVRRGADGSIKDTLFNIQDTKECVIQVVTFSIVEQVNLCSVEYSDEINEFEKSGLTMVKSLEVKPPRVKESPFQMECRLKDVVSFGKHGGAGQLVLCEVILFHIDDAIISDEKIDPTKMNSVSRNGGNWYTHSNADSLFELPRPPANNCVGYDKLPKLLFGSKILSAHNLTQLASAIEIPSLSSSKLYCEQQAGLDKKDLVACAKILLDEGDISNAWKILVYLEASL